MSGDEGRDWLHQVSVSARQQGLRPTVQGEADHRWLEIQFMSGVSSQSGGRVSLADVPSDAQIEMRLDGSVRWVVTDLGPRSSALVKLRASGHRQPLRVHLESAVTGTVVLDAENSDPVVTADDDCAARLVLISGVVSVGQEGLGSASVELQGGTLGGCIGDSTYGDVHLTANSSVSPIENHSVRVASLIVEKDATLSLPGGGGRYDIDSIQSGGHPVVLRLTRHDVGGRGTPSAPELKVTTLKDLTITSDAGVVIDIVKNAANVTVEGATHLKFGRRAVGDRVNFKTGGSTRPTLSAMPDALMTEMSGEVNLGSVRGAHLAGTELGLLVAKVAMTSTTGERCGDEAFLSGLKFPRGLTGRLILNQFDDAHHFEPATKGLPGWDMRFFRRGEPSDVKLRHDAELMRKMRELAIEKGASGAARTKVAWCAQRLRHVTTRGKLERLALLGYRSLGYGERPAPAFVSWLVLSLIFAAVLSLDLHTGPDCGGVFRCWAERAASPVGSVLGSGSGPEVNAWLYLVRAFVAVPLVVGVLALRNYVRSGRH